jgi:hypothetical protein
MKIRMLFIGLCLITGLAGCSVQNRLIRDYKGKTLEELMLRMGRATRIEENSGGLKVHIYEKSKFLKAATINTGRFQYDKFESPKAVKTETYKFFIDTTGRVEDVMYEVSYGR